MPAFGVEFAIPGRRAWLLEGGDVCGLAAEDYLAIYDDELVFGHDVGAVVVRPGWGDIKEVVFAELAA